MQILFDLDHIPLLKAPAVLTMGSFDGLHLGHQYLLQQLKMLGKEQEKVVITFSNHPAEVLRKNSSISMLSSLEHKVRLLEKEGIDLLLLFEFTPSLAEQTYDAFIKNLLARLPFSHLVLGENARFGKNREGDPEKLVILGKELGFTPVYVPKYSVDDSVVSSGKIREAVSEKNLDLAEKLLGRPYSIYAPFRYHDRAFITDKMTLRSLALPPSGTYEVSIADQDDLFSGTLEIDREDRSLVLKPHQLNRPFKNLFLEVIFSNPLRKNS